MGKIKQVASKTKTKYRKSKTVVDSHGRKRCKTCQRYM